MAKESGRLQETSECVEEKVSLAVEREGEGVRGAVYEWAG